jgi:RNA recognition motif-containing protein
VKSVDFPQDRLHTHTGRGFAYIEFETPNEAENAMKHMDGGMEGMNVVIFIKMLFTGNLGFNVSVWALLYM